MAAQGEASLLSKIVNNNGHGEESAFFEGWKAYDSDPYHPIENPGGVIQMGLAENQVYIYNLYKVLIHTC